MPPRTRKPPQPADDRWLEYVALDNVQFADRNPKRHDIDGIKGSIDRFGVAALPTRDERTGRLVAGHGRIESLRAMRDEGQDPPSGVRKGDDGSWWVPLVCGWRSRSDAEAETYVIGDNEWTIQGGFDHRILAEMLADAREFDETLLEIAGFNDERLEDIVAGLDGPDSLDDLEKEFGEPDDEAGWPTIRVNVPHDVFDLWNALMDTLGDDRPEFERVRVTVEMAQEGLQRKGKRK